MNSTKLYFLLSFKTNEYKQLKIEVLLVKEQNYDKEKLTDIYDISNINDYMIKIGIFDFKKKNLKIIEDFI